MSSTQDMREAWADWKCQEGPGEFVDVELFGKSVGGVAAPAAEAFRALEHALSSAGYEPEQAWAYSCRKIGESEKYSLHAYGIAIDIDPNENPYSAGDPYSGKLKAEHVDAVREIKNAAGTSVWRWGGDFANTPDRMHFQLAVGPDDLSMEPAS